MRRFRMVRRQDETGVSGTGHVLDGVVFEGGFCVIVWRSETPSVNIYRTYEDFETVHITSHPGNETEVEWLPVPDFEARVEAELKRCGMSSLTELVDEFLRLQAAE